MIRRLLAAALLFFGAVIANVGIVAWWFDREVTEPERIHEMATTVLRSPEIRADLAPLIIGEATQELGLDAAANETVTDAVEATLLDPAYVDTYADAIVSLYRQVFEDPELAELSFETAGLETSLVATLEKVDPRLAELLTSVELPGSVDLSIEQLPDLTSVERGLSTGWRIALIAGGVLLVAGILVHPRATVALRRIGLLFMVFAGLQALAVWLITDLAAPRLPLAGSEALAAAGAEIILASLTAQAIVQAVLAGALAVVAHLAIWVPRVTAPFRAVTATMGS